MSPTGRALRCCTGCWFERPRGGCAAFSCSRCKEEAQPRITYRSGRAVQRRRPDADAESLRQQPRIVHSCGFCTPGALSPRRMRCYEKQECDDDRVRSMPSGAVGPLTTQSAVCHRLYRHRRRGPVLEGRRAVTKRRRHVMNNHFIGPDTIGTSLRGTSRPDNARPPCEMSRPKCRCRVCYTRAILRSARCARTAAWFSTRVCSAAGAQRCAEVSLGHHRRRQQGGPSIITMRMQAAAGNFKP